VGGGSNYTLSAVEREMVTPLTNIVTRCLFCSITKYVTEVVISYVQSRRVLSSEAFRDV
jgi:hypothetical protein